MTTTMITTTTTTPKRPRATTAMKAAKAKAPKTPALQTRAVLDRAISEEELMRDVRHMLKLYGWRLVYHTWMSTHSGAGFPDICAVKGKRLLFAELKRQQSHVSEEQQQWLDALAATGTEAYLWRPSHLVAGIIDRVLAANERPRRQEPDPPPPILLSQCGPKHLKPRRYPKWVQNWID